MARSTTQTLELKAKQTLNSQLSTLNLINPHLWSTNDPYLYKVETTVKVNGQVTGHGTGHSKKEAEQAAARDALGSAQGDSLRKAEHVF